MPPAEQAAGPDIAPLLDLLFVTAKERFVPRPEDPDDGDALYRPLAQWIAERATANVSYDFAPLEEGQSRTKPGPFVVGVAGGVAAGKTMLAGLLADLLRRADGTGRVAVISADGFLYSNAELAARGLSQRKGFPESYDTAALFSALALLKAGRSALIPGYSHLSYDVAPGAQLDPPDVVVIEGIIVLQVPLDGVATVPSDLIDLGIYVDASESDLRRWYALRLAELFDEARSDPSSFYHQWAGWDDDEVARFADAVWQSINVVNLRNHIAPSRLRADVIVVKKGDHRVSRVLLRRP